jgi:hypothetical protein
MAYRLTQRRLEKLRVECVFGLTGGELNDRPWRGFRYNYDGAPEWLPPAWAEFRDGAEYKTACIEDAPYGVSGEAPRGWERVAVFAHSGEASCNWCGDGTGDEEQRPKCKLCGGDGYVYLGSACEVVFRRKVRS